MRSQWSLEDCRVAVEKLAALMQVLHQAARKVRPLRFPARASVGGSSTIGTAMREGVSPAFSVGRSSQIRGLTGVLGKAGVPKPQLRSIRKSHAQEAGRYSGRILKRKGDISSAITPMTASPGAVRTGRTEVGTMAPRIEMPTKPVRLSGEGKRGVNTAALLHEGFERKIRPHQMSPFAGHLSPKVLMDEHNLVLRATGAGAGEMRAAMGGLRRASGETRAMEDFIRQKYGERGVQYVRQHGYSKAMKKDLVRSARKKNVESTRAAMDAAARGVS